MHSKQTLAWLAGSALLLALTTLTAAPAWADDTVQIKLARVAGTVEALQAEATGGEWLAAYPGDEFGVGWSLRTGSDGKALLVFPLGNTVVLKANSYLTVNALDAGGGAQLESSDGGLLVDIQHKLQPGSEFQVDTGAALAVVRGTKFGVAYRQGGRASQPTGRRARRLKRQVRFYGYEGTVTLRNSQGEQALEHGYDVDADEGQRLHRAQRSSREAGQFLKRLERADEFERFEQEHPKLDELVKQRELKRKAAIERFQQRHGGQAGDASAKPERSTDRGPDADSQSDHTAKTKDGKRHPGRDRRKARAVKRDAGTPGVPKKKRKP